MSSFFSALFSRQMLAIFLLGFASGLPLGLTASVLQAWFTDAGLNVKAIGLLGLIGLPYLYKFFWAPIFDRWQVPLLDRRRGWLLVLQLAIAGCIYALTWFAPQEAPWQIGFIALLIATLSASQDIVFDAYRTDVLSAELRGLGSSFMVVGYRLALLAAGGLGLILAQVFGWTVMYRIMALLMGVGVLGTLIAPGVLAAAHPPTTLLAAIYHPFRAFRARFGLATVLLILTLVLLYKLSDAAVLSLNTTFLMRTGFSLMDIGTINKGMGFVATLLGSFAGGLLMSRLSLYQALMRFGVLQIASNIFYVFLAIYGKHHGLMILAIVSENFCSGMGTVAFLAFLMHLCEVEFSATQFALLSAFSSVGRVFMGPVAGALVSRMGWTDFYIFTMLIGLPGLSLLWWMRHAAFFTQGEGTVQAVAPKPIAEG